MSDHSSDENESEYIFYRDRPDWRDVVPLKQDDGEHPVVSIDYTEIFEDCYDYFRAILAKKEISERALELTETAAGLNPANYTVWQYRRDILKGLKKDLHEELEFMTSIILKNTKNYQVWHHRRVIVELLQDPSKERYVTDLALLKDSKNYHAWQHRQWAIKTFKLYEEELNYVDSLISEDVKNNSVWNQRYFVINNTTGFTDDVLDNEVQYTLEKIKLEIENESAWNYLRGLLIHNKNGISQNEKVTSFCEELYKSGCRSPFVLALIVDMCFENVNKTDKEVGVYTVERAKTLCDELANKYDIIRAKYWNYMASTIGKTSELDDTGASNN